MYFYCQNFYCHLTFIFELNFRNSPPLFYQNVAEESQCCVFYSVIFFNYEKYNSAVSIC